MMVLSILTFLRHCLSSEDTGSSGLINLLYSRHMLPSVLLQLVDPGVKLKNVSAMCHNESIDSSTQTKFEVRIIICYIWKLVNCTSHLSHVCRRFA